MGQFKYAMHMVRHDNIVVQDHIWKMLRYFQPTIIGYLTCSIQNHAAIDHITKQHGPVLAAKRDEIKTSLRIVIVFQPYGPPMMDLRIVLLHRGIFLVGKLDKKASKIKIRFFLKAFRCVFTQ